jgi:hypothetical protein
MANKEKNTKEEPYLLNDEELDVRTLLGKYLVKNMI